MGDTNPKKAPKKKSNAKAQGQSTASAGTVKKQK